MMAGCGASSGVLLVGAAPAHAQPVGPEEPPRKTPLVPYVGVFGSRYFIYDGVDDVNTVGSRAGLIYVGGSLLLGLGVAVEHVVSDCTEDCTSVYPDFTLSVSL
jgi:hypothetical protein